MSFWIRMALSIATSLGGLGAIQFSVSVEFGNMPINPPVAVDQLGWTAEFDRAAYEQIPTLQILGDSPDDHMHDNIRLYEFVRAVNNGQDVENIKQLIGDCVSHATDKACETLKACQIYTSGSHEPLPNFVPMWFYGVSRVLIGKGSLGNGDGSKVPWAVEGLPLYGALPFDTPGVPEYSAQVAKSWGINGPPKEFMAIAQRYKVRGIRRCPSAREAILALANGYPLITGSQYGTKQLIVQDGRRVGPHTGSWSHSMPCMAYDGSSPSGQGYFNLHNSWGEDAHGEPLQGEPRGSFWVTYEVFDWICKTGMVFAISDMETFTKRNLDFDVLGAVVQRPGALQEDVFMSAFAIGVALCFVSLMVWLPSKPRIFSIMLMLCMLPQIGQCADPPGLQFDALEVAPLQFQSLEVSEPATVPQIEHPKNEVTIFSMDPCPPCVALKNAIGTGDLYIHVVYKDRSEMPPELLAIADKQGYPFAYCYANRKYIEHAPRNLDDLKYLMRLPLNDARHYRR